MKVNRRGRSVREPRDETVLQGPIGVRKTRVPEIPVQGLGRALFLRCITNELEKEKKEKKKKEKGV